MLLRMSNYNIELHWSAGKEMIFSNHLSRNVPNDKSKEPMCQGLDMKIHDVYLNVSSDKCVSLAAETEKRRSAMYTKNQIIKGWLGQRSECPRNLIDHWNYRNKLGILDGLIPKGTRIVISNQCRDEILVQLHEGHFGID